MAMHDDPAGRGPLSEMLRCAAGGCADPLVAEWFAALAASSEYASSADLSPDETAPPPPPGRESG